jgi:peptidoglycan hydrolase-like protein with peptidoglycan-binding domain
MRRRTLWIAGACFVAALLVATFGVTRSSSSAAESSDAGTDDKPATTSVAVARRDLIAHEDVAGDLGYRDSRSISAPRMGTVTVAPEPGDVIDRGQSLITVDDRQLPLFFGDVPLWRSLSAASTDGPDIRQLEENLVALGFASPDELTVDEHFDAATQAAVVEWQESLDVTANGIVEVGDLVFQPGPVRVTSVDAEVGDPATPQGPVLKVTDTDRVVTVRLEVAYRDLTAVGDAVQIDIGDGKTVDGTVVSVGKIATAEESSEQNPGADTEPKITVEIALDDPSSTGTLDEAPVEVQFTTKAAVDVLAVPVEALLALAEGGYAVEVERAGKTELVGVDLGAFADGFVEITGEVDEGEMVVVPR